MSLRAKNRNSQVRAAVAANKAEFQADLAAAQDRIIRDPKGESQAVLSRVKVKWTERELAAFAELASAAEANPPTDALIRAMR